MSLAPAPLTPPAALWSLALLIVSRLQGTLQNDAAGAVRGWNSSELAAVLRRQLMDNNYDYMSSESEQLPRHPRAEPAPPAPLGDLLPFVNDIYVPRVSTAPDTPPDFADYAEEVVTRAPDHTDLLYYMSEGHLRRRADPPPLPPATGPGDPSLQYNYNPPKMKPPSDAPPGPAPRQEDIRDAETSMGN